jgi:hypothetical protein
VIVVAIVMRIGVDGVDPREKANVGMRTYMRGEFAVVTDGR